MGNLTRKDLLLSLGYVSDAGNVKREAVMMMTIIFRMVNTDLE